MVRVNECTGECCARFYLPFNRLSMRKAYLDTLAVSRGHRVDAWFQDLVVWYPLLEYDGPAGAPYDEGGYWRCTAWDKESGLCRIYEHRPAACARYPYGKRCVFCFSKGNDSETKGDEMLNLEGDEVDER